MGARCEDATNLEVIGVCCHVEVYEFGHFNANHKNGFHAKFKEGKFTRQDLSERGVLDNDISSLRVKNDQECVERLGLNEFKEGKENNKESDNDEDQEMSSGDGPKRPVSAPREGERFTVPWWFWLIFCAVPAA